MKPRPKGGYSETYELGPQTVLIASGGGWDEESFAALRTACRPEVLVIHLAAGDSLQVLDEDQMRAAGWVRANP